MHMKPNFSQTLIIPHMFTASPPGPDGQPVEDPERFQDFYEEVSEVHCAFNNSGLICDVAPYRF